MGSHNILSIVGGGADRNVEERRGKGRQKVLLSAVIVTTTAEQPAKVRDISVAGASIECERPLPRGTDIILRRGAEELFAQIAWSSGQRCGLEFDEVLTERELAGFTNQPVRVTRNVAQPVQPRPSLAPEALTPDQWAMIESWGRPAGRGAFGE